MMRGLFLFASHLFAGAQATTSQEKAECLVEGGEAVDDLLDASIFLWQLQSAVAGLERE
jgi:hypothetical protein